MRRHVIRRLLRLYQHQSNQQDGNNNASNPRIVCIRLERAAASLGAQLQSIAGFGPPQSLHVANRKECEKNGRRGINVSGYET